MDKNKKASQTKTLKRVLLYINKYKLILILSVILAAASVGLMLYVPVLIGRAIDNIVSEGNVNFEMVMIFLQKTAFIVFGAAVSQWLMSILNTKITTYVIRDIRTEAFEKIQSLPLSFIDRHGHGDIVSRMISDVDQFADGLLMGFSQLFTGIVTIVGTLIFMLSINIEIALVVALLTPLSLFVASFIAKKTYSMFTKQSEVRGEQTAYIDEMIGNQKVVQAYSRCRQTMEHFDEINDRLEKFSLKAVFYSSLTNPSTRFINALVYAAVAVTGAFASIGGVITVGGLACFLSYATQYTKPFNEISGVLTELQNALACAARVFELIEAEPETAEGSKTLKNVAGSVDFEHVCFSYIPEKPLITDFNLKVAPGNRIAIVGPTGCGKTTLINLIMRFYDTVSGSILIDGINIRDLKRDSLRSSFGMVLQETWLKSGTVIDNIRMGRPEATRDEVIAAAKESFAHSFIMRLPNGYDTVLSEDGGSLSEGQRQLLCISRVMLCLPPMLILDEATSSIDTRTEQKIQKAFSRLMENKTSFIVAHRLSTIKEADLILVMKEGKVIEQGNHNQLLAKKGFYSVLYNSQFAK